MRIIPMLGMALVMSGAQGQSVKTGLAAGEPTESADMCLKRAVSYRDNGDRQHAIAELRQALALQPGLRAAHSLLGELLLEARFFRNLPGDVLLGHGPLRSDHGPGGFGPRPLARQQVSPPRLWVQGPRQKAVPRSSVVPDPVWAERLPAETPGAPRHND